MYVKVCIMVGISLLENIILFMQQYNISQYYFTVIYFYLYIFISITLLLLYLNFPTGINKGLSYLILS